MSRRQNHVQKSFTLDGLFDCNPRNVPETDEQRALRSALRTTAEGLGFELCRPYLGYLCGGGQLASEEVGEAGDYVLQQEFVEKANLLPPTMNVQCPMESCTKRPSVRRGFDPSDPDKTRRRPVVGSRTNFLKRRLPTKRAREWTDVVNRRKELQAALEQLVYDKNPTSEWHNGPAELFRDRTNSELQEEPYEENENNSRIPDENYNFIPRMLPEHTFILIREITSRIQVHQVRERMVEGLQFSNQFVLGAATGWVGAYLIKNFGKSALTAVGGGFLILAFATRKGFVEVNWNRVLVELQKRDDALELLRQRSRTDNSSSSPLLPESALSVGEDWTVEKIHGAKKWIVEHSVAVGGFAVGFLYNIL